MKLMTVQAANVFEDEMNPRKDFGDLKALAESFRANGGQPYTPPIIVKDGDNYRIADGARRFRAMTKVLKLTEFDANVCEDFDEADTILAMLATDDKKQLTDAEKSAGVQRALFLGVEVSAVEKASRRGSLAKAKNAMFRVGDAAPGMSIEHLIAIEENAADPDAVKRLTECDEKHWENVMRDIVRERGIKEKAEEFKAAFEELGIELIQRQHLPREAQRVYISIGNVDALREEAGKRHLEYAIALYPGTTYTSYEFYNRDGSSAPTKQKSEEEKRCDELRDAFMATADQSHARRAEWYLSKVNDADHATTTKRFLTCIMFDIDDEDAEHTTGSNPGRLHDVLELHEADADYGIVSGYLAAFLWSKVDGFTSTEPAAFNCFRFDYLKTWGSESRAFRIEQMLDLYEAMQADGYEMDEADEKLAETMRAMLPFYGWEWASKDERQKGWF